MTGGARPVAVLSRAQFPLAQWRCEVLAAEGAVQLRLFADGMPCGPISTANAFADARTATELRAIADWLEAMIWS